MLNLSAMTASFFALLLLIVSHAAANPTRFDLSATCIAGCAQVGAADGETAVGFVVIDTQGLSPNIMASSDRLSPAPITDFSFTFGSATVSLSTAAAFSFLIEFGSDLTSLARFQGAAVNEQVPGSGDGVLILFNDPGNRPSQASLDAFCNDDFCGDLTFNTPALFDDVVLMFQPNPPPPPPPPPTDVPETPASPALPVPMISSGFQLFLILLVATLASAYLRRQNS